MAGDDTYQKTAATYAEQLRTLFVPSPESADQEPARRSGTRVASDELADRVDRLVDTSKDLGQMNTGYLDAADEPLREAAELKLLTQAMAEIQVAQELLEAAHQEEAGAASPDRTAPARRSARANVERAVAEWADLLEKPLEEGIAPYARGAVHRSTRGERPTQPAAAHKALRDAVQTGLRRIAKQAGKVGGRAAQTLLLMDPETLKKGVALVSAEAAELAERVIQGFSAVAKRLVTSAVRLLLQAYDWILALLGQDVEQKARKQVKAWIDELRADPAENGERTGLVDRLVDAIYGPAEIESEVATWMDATNADVETVNGATAHIEHLEAAYRIKTERVDGFLKVVGLTRVAPIPVVKTPQFQVILAGVAMGLLGYVVYAGYDHVDSGGALLEERYGFRVFNRVTGVRETVHTALVAPQPRS
jgi:hypothetical protein